MKCSLTLTHRPTMYWLLERPEATRWLQNKGKEIQHIIFLLLSSFHFFPYIFHSTSLSSMFQNNLGTPVNDLQTPKSTQYAWVACGLPWSVMSKGYISSIRFLNFFLLRINSVQFITVLCINNTIKIEERIGNTQKYIQEMREKVKNKQQLNTLSFQKISGSIFHRAFGLEKKNPVKMVDP